MRVSENQRSYLRFIADHPGTTKAAVGSACRRNPLAGHRHVYDGVTRLQRRGLVIDMDEHPSRCALYLTREGWSAL